MGLIFVKRRPEPQAGEALLSEKSKLSQYINQLHSNMERSKYERNLRISKSYYFIKIRDLDPYWSEVVHEQFNGRCAYCESFVESHGIVEYFRPVNGVKNSQIDQNDPEYNGDLHYIWLGYKWDNLVFVCPECSYSKGNYFPVHDRRAALFTDVRNESHLIIDPCKDYPEEHLYYDSEGELFAKSRKGKVTIELLDLNRQQLVRDRKKQMRKIREILEDNTVTNYLLLDKGVFSESLIKQLVAEWIMQMDEHRLLQLGSSTYWSGKLRELYGNYRTTKQLMDKIHPYSNSINGGDHSGQVSSFKGNRIEYIKIQNIRGITLEHTFNRHEKNESWFMLLGENGTGKTTVLKAVAMALTGSWRGLGIKASSFLTSGNDAEIIVKLEGSNNPVKVQITPHDVVHLNPPPPMPVVAYGAVRLIPSLLRRSAKRTVHWHNVRNLFAKSSTGYFVNHPSEWLDDQEPLLRDIARMILDVLPFEEQEQIDMVVERGKAYIERNGRRIALHELSSGYQSIIALITDIARTLHQTSGLSKFAEGLVLIDEIDAHLHPSWKSNIVEKLRAAFPRMQFIVTSHDPLCLRGTHYGEIAVMKRTGDEVTVITDLPDQEGMRVDQILTSEFFDLHSTLGHKTDSIIAQYQRLLSQNYLDSDNRDELNKIETELNDPSIRYLGYTNRERLMYQAIDQFIVNRKKDRIAYNELDEETRSELLRIWEADEDDL